MKLKIFSFICLCLVLLGGCDKKEARDVFQLVNDQISAQNQCQTDNQTLSDLMNQETRLYNDLMEKGIEDFEEVKPLIEEAREAVFQSQQYLENYQQCRQNLNFSLEELEEHLAQIDDQELKQQTEALIADYVDYHQKLQLYIESLLILNQAESLFYDELNETTTIARTDELITAINLALEESQEYALEYQTALATFNTSYNAYYDAYIK